MDTKIIATQGGAQNKGLPTYHFAQSGDTISCAEDAELALITYPTSKSVIVEQSVEISGQTMVGSIGSVFTVSVVNEGENVMVSQVFFCPQGSRLTCLYRGLVNGEVFNDWAMADWPIANTVEN